MVQHGYKGKDMLLHRSKTMKLLGLQHAIQPLHLLHSVLDFALDLVSNSLMVLARDVDCHVLQMLLPFLDFDDNIVKQALQISLTSSLRFAWQLLRGFLFWWFALEPHPFSQSALFSIIQKRSCKPSAVTAATICMLIQHCFSKRRLRSIWYKSAT